MFISLSLILAGGVAAGMIFRKMKLPGLLGMMLFGLLIGPYCLNLLDPTLLAGSGTIRKIALLIILIRAGLNLKIEDLKKAGRPALLLCFVPATFEIAAFIIFAPMLLGIDLVSAALMGCVMAAVSPAVVVPSMLKVMKAGYGQDKAIPQMILAGASADDIYVLVLFSVLMSIAGQGSFEASTLLRLPTAILLGLGAGFLGGLLLVRLFSKEKKYESAAVNVIVILAFGLLFYGVEEAMTGPVAFSGLIAIMAACMVLGTRVPERIRSTAAGFDALWKAGEIFLFTLIGAAVNLPYAFKSFGVNVLLIVLCLLVRTAGVLLCVSFTRLSWKERLFCVAAYLPKATVQAAIGAVPLAAGLPTGEQILSCAVTAILITAPAGAILIDRGYTRLLTPPSSKKNESTTQNTSK